MRPQRSVLREVDMIDILLTVFTRTAWSCWQAQIDFSVNRIGWGYDTTFGTRCHARMAVVDREVVEHAPTQRSYSQLAALADKKRWLRHTNLPDLQGRTLRFHYKPSPGLG